MALALLQSLRARTVALLLITFLLSNEFFSYAAFSVMSSSSHSLPAYCVCGAHKQAPASPALCSGPQSSPLISVAARCVTVTGLTAG